MGQLRNDHDELRAAMRRFAGMMAEGYEAARGALTRERVIFSQLLRQHVADEEAQVRATLPGDPLATRLAGDMQALQREYSAHVSRWTPARIEAEWDDYQRAVLVLQRRMMTRLAWEERELFARLPDA